MREIQLKKNLIDSSKITMNKDVIYIDVDDDVTAIIGKIKKAKEKIVAIVPQSVPAHYRARLICGCLSVWQDGQKKLVLIYGKPALVALAANAKIPVAKNLQSKLDLLKFQRLLLTTAIDIIDGLNYRLATT